MLLWAQRRTLLLRLPDALALRISMSLKETLVMGSLVYRTSSFTWVILIENSTGTVELLDTLGNKLCPLNSQIFAMWLASVDECVVCEDGYNREAICNLLDEHHFPYSAPVESRHVVQGYLSPVLQSHLSGIRR